VRTIKGGEKGHNVVVRDIIFGGENISLALEIPRQCLLVLLLEINLKNANSVGSEESKAIGCGL
jgi:hypothetical protein